MAYPASSPGAGDGAGRSTAEGSRGPIFRRFWGFARSRPLGPGLVALILPTCRAMRSSSVQLDPLLLTVPDAARRLHRHEQTVRAMIRRGDLAAIRLGRLVRIFASAVEQTTVMPELAAVRPRRPGRDLRGLAARVRA